MYESVGGKCKGSMGDWKAGRTRKLRQLKPFDSTNIVTPIGSSGDWKFHQVLENDGTSLLKLVYKTQQVQAFLPAS